MKLSNPLLLFTILVLSNCNGLQTPMLQEEVSKPSEPEHLISINHKYLPLLDILERMRVFNEEEADITPPPFGKTATAKEKQAYLENLKNSRTTRDGFVELLYNETLNLLQDKKSIDEYLLFLIKRRYDYLQGRQHIIHTKLSSTKTEVGTTLPTDKKLFDFLMQAKGYARNKDYNELIRIHTVSRFELLNLLIKESFTKCSLDELSRETIQLLRASVQLHPILTGERQDLGHPDEAGSAYTLLKPIVINCSEKTFRTTHGEQLSNLLGASELLNLLKGGEYEYAHMTTLKKLYGMILQQEQKNEQVAQELLAMKKESDLETYEAHFVSRNLFLPFKNLGTPKERPHGVTVFGTQYELSIWPYELPNPAFLQLPQVQEPAILYSLEEQSKKETQVISFVGLSNEPAEAQSANNFSFEKEKSACTIIADTTMSTATALAEANSVEKQEIKEATQIPLSSLQKEIPAKKKPSTSKKLDAIVLSQAVDTQPGNAFSFDRDWVIPSGLRSFHSQMLHIVYPVRTLHSKFQLIVNNLFHNQVQCKVTFTDFQNLWNHIGGQIISNHSGSHRQLIGPSKEKLFGIFAHNDNQVYGPKYVKYLQTAVLYVGLRPTQWILK